MLFLTRYFSSFSDKSGSVLFSDPACNDNTGSFACFSKCVTSGVVQYNVRCKNAHVYCGK